MRVALRRIVPRPLRRSLAWADLQLEQGAQRMFERRYGVETAGHVYLDEIGEEGAGRTFYEGIGWWPLRRALSALELGAGDVFVDLGSGRGQALVVAGRFPIERATGVELAGDLTRVARRNLDAARPRMRARSLETVTADVLYWPVPDDVSVVFMYSPFIGELFAQAIERIFASYDRNPRTLHLVYAFPWEHNRLLATGRVQVVDVHPAQWPAKPWWPWSAWVMPTYRVVAPGAPSGAPRRRLRGPLQRRALARWSAPNDQRFALYRPGVGLIEDY